MLAILYEKNIRSPATANDMLINHTHPGGTMTPSVFDIDYLIDVQSKGSPQKSSVILPKDKPAVKFDKNTKPNGKE